MTKTLRILFLILMLAWAGIGDAHAENRQKRDRLRWNDVAEQPAPQAILADGQTSCRLVPVRPQRISPSGESKTQPTHGRTCSANLTNRLYSFGLVARPVCQLARTMQPASSAKTFIALRHIIR